MRKLAALILVLIAAPLLAQAAGTPPSGFKFQPTDTQPTRDRKLELLRQYTAGLSTSAGVSSFNTRTGAVSLTSGDVTGALTFTPLSPANNLSDVSSASTARTNLGLGTAATQPSTAFAAASHQHAYTDVISIPSGSLIYRKTAGTGAAETQTLATLKTDLGLTGTNSGDQTITLSGAVSGSGTGAITTTLGTGVVGLSNMANVATGTLFYRKTAGSGAPEVNTLATLKTDLGLTGTNSGDQTITLTGDVTGSGTGSFAATLATVNSNVGTFGDATHVAQVTVNGKGLVTAASSVALTGSYPWTETVLTSDFTNSTTTANVITDGTRSLSFTPPANSNWQAEAILLIQSAATTTGPRVGVSVSAQGTGAYGSCLIENTGATSNTFGASFCGWTTTAGGTASTIGDWPTANVPFLVRVTIRGHSGASPASISITLASEIASSTVTAKAGSLLRTKST